MAKKPPKSILFVVKRKSEYAYSGCGDEIMGGLYNSAKFVTDMLVQEGFDSNLVVVKDNNEIDREVTKYKPDVVMIEAFWVVPEKFDVLKPLHPNVKWYVRNHSEVPFLAQEGNALQWTRDYLLQDNVYVSCNSWLAYDDLKTAAEVFKPGLGDKLNYLPNYYPPELMVTRNKPLDPKVVNIACFGAIRPLKNQLMQAIAALRYASEQNKILRFHINSTRCEQGGDSVYKNLVNLFSGTKHELVDQPWMEHDEFLDFLTKNIDVGMQVSFTETFNIVSADYVASDVPIVVSEEVTWASPFSQADVTDSEDITSKIYSATLPLTGSYLRKRNRKRLQEYSKSSVKLWTEFLK